MTIAPGFWIIAFGVLFWIAGFVRRFRPIAFFIELPFPQHPIWHQTKSRERLRRIGKIAVICLRLWRLRHGGNYTKTGKVACIICRRLGSKLLEGVLDRVVESERRLILAGSLA